MDPITLILAAVAAGAAVIAKEAVSAATKDAYNALKARIRHKFEDKPNAEIALIGYEQNPKEWETPFRDALIEVTAQQDEEIIKAAQKVMSHVNTQQIPSDIQQYIVNIGGVEQQFITNKVDTMNINPPHK